MLHQCRDELTRHASIRVVQRSIRETDLRVVQDWADEEEHRRDGAIRLTLSPCAARMAIKAGVSANVAERAQRIALVVKDACVLTAYRRKPRKDTRALLRGRGRA